MGKSNRGHCIILSMDVISKFLWAIHDKIQQLPDVDSPAIYETHKANHKKNLTCTASTTKKVCHYIYTCRFLQMAMWVSYYADSSKWLCGSPIMQIPPNSYVGLLLCRFLQMAMWVSYYADSSKRLCGSPIMQIPPNGYVGLLWCSTTVATVSWGTLKSTMKVLHRS